MTWKVEINAAALKQLANLDKPVRRRIATAIEKLADDPTPPGCRKIVTSDDLLRIRVGDYRVKYAVLDQKLVVLVVEVVHRSKAY
ncbi:type II toxin-antitoxin system RelE family toxin [Micromonospora sp. NPDC004704]